MFRKLLAVALLIFIVYGMSSCGKPSKSQRDVTRDELRNTAENKRKELQPLVGKYQGTLDLPGGRSQDVSLNLVIREVPMQVDGQVDPVMTPALGGELRFDFGTGNSVVEYVPFNIEKGDFETKAGNVSLVCSSGTYKNLNLQLKKEESQLTGLWNIEKYGSGALRIKKIEKLDNLVSEPLNGTYRGMLVSDPELGLPEHMEVTIVTSPDPSQPEGMKITGNMRLYFGGFDSPDFMNWGFETVEPNYFLGILSVKSKKDGLTLNVNLQGKKLSGAASSNILGHMGTYELEKI